MRKLRNFIGQIASLIIIASPTPYFVLFINIKYISKKLPDRVTYDRQKQVFHVKAFQDERFFRTKFQNYNSYKDGLKQRNLKLISEYHLNNLHINAEDLIVDCGANIGDFWFALRQISDEFQYLAFEPSPQEFQLLEQNIGQRGKCFNIGLWNREDKLVFYISNANADSSFIKPGKYTEYIEIDAKRMDQVFDKRIKLLKLEAEGAELQVLMGMGRLLERCEYITADVGFENKNKSTLPEVTNYLLERDFEIISFGFPRIVVLFRNKITQN